MNRKRYQTCCAHLRLWAAVLVLLTVISAFSGTPVFEMPGVHLRHLQLLALMDASHERKDYVTMETACREGAKLGTTSELWAYNLTCALALQGKAQAALAALDQAIAAGFNDAEHVSQDTDLASLRDSDAFKQRLAQMAARSKAGAPLSSTPVAMCPDASMTVTQSASNTLWSFQLGIFNAFVAAPPHTPAAYHGPEASAINAWLHDGTASGCAGLLYANRDNNTQPLSVALYPGLLRLAYSQEMIDRRLHIGLPNTLFALENGISLTPVIGHSSMGYLNSPYWRSQPRAICGDPRQMALQSLFLLGNQLFFYPVYGDFDPVSGDLFPANSPYSFAVAGSNNAEQPFVAAALAALAAFRPETRADLTRTGLLMPTLQMLFRASQRTVKTRQDYLSGFAHPPAFQAENLDTARLVRMAHTLATNDVPPLVILTVLRENQMIPDRDFFDIIRTEQQFDSPLAVARVFRGAPRTRTLEVRAQCKRTDAKLHWVVLQGDTKKITFTPCPTNNAVMTLTVAHHQPFSTPLGNGKTIMTSRVDIGVIAETEAGFSLPSFISFCFLGNERRAYSDDGRILSIDYTRPMAGYIDPLMSYTRNWKDSYQYDAQGNMTGWTRSRGLSEERFTAYGHRIVSSDARGRATRAHVVRYLPRSIKLDETVQGLPDLAQMDDNLEVLYRYASDIDFVGAPDLSTLTQETQPPAFEP
jgi:hypothetical protein